MALPFTKVEGLGNDFLVVDLRPGVRPRPPAARRPRIRRSCARSAIATSASAATACWRSCPARTGDARMRVLNADGSEAEMCGNGIRCVAKVLYDTDPALRRPALRIETGAGVLALRRWTSRTGRVRTSTVDMGRPRLTRDEIPILRRRRRRACCASRSRARGRTFHVHRRLDGQPARGDLRRRCDVVCARSPRSSARCSRRPSAFPSAPTSSSRTCARRRDRSGRLGARQRHHPGVRHRRVRDRRRRLPGRAAAPGPRRPSTSPVER